MDGLLAAALLPALPLLLPGFLAPSSEEVRRLADSRPPAGSFLAASTSALLPAAEGAFRGARKPAAWTPLGEWMAMARRL